MHGKASNIFLIKSYQKSPKIWFYFIFKLQSSKARVAIPSLENISAKELLSSDIDIHRILDIVFILPEFNFNHSIKVGNRYMNIICGRNISVKSLLNEQI